MRIHVLPANNKVAGCEFELWDCGGDPEFESYWRALMKDSHGVVIVFNASILSHLKEIEMWYSCFVQQQFLQNTLCLLIAHNKPGSGSDKENPALGKEPGVLASVWNALGICMLLCVLAANSSVQFVSTCCVLAICFPHHVNQNCRVSRSTQARLQTL